MLESETKRTLCYITCAYPDCYKKISYFKGETPDKYCGEHNVRDRSNLLEKPELKPTQIPQVILRCPKCKQRYEMIKSEWLSGKKMSCICGTELLFHKEVGEK